MRRLFAVFLLGVAGCSQDVPPPPLQKDAPFPVFAEARLAQGREVWLGTCRGCHDIGVAGAPRIGDATQWNARAEQGRNVLYRHALEGFFGPGGTMMPARGGNDALADDQVRAAVDYMVAASTTATEAASP